MTLHPRPRRAFTIVELLVVIGIIVLLISIMLPSLCRSREQGNRVKCSSNLRQIGLALQMYANDNNGSFPRTIFDGSPNPVPAFYTQPQAPHPFQPGGPAANDVTASFFLVLRTQDLTAEVFNCPSSSAERMKGDPTKMSNFESADVLSYSYINPFPTAAAEKAGFRLDSKLGDEFAVAADMNPGRDAVVQVVPKSKRTEMIRANSANHGGDGQNVLYGDGHVEFQSTPFCGTPRTVAAQQFRDNIYVAGGPGTPSSAVLVGAAADAADSILLPVAAGGPVPAGSPQERVAGVRKVTWMVASAGFLVAATSLLGLTTVRRRRRAREGDAANASAFGRELNHGDTETRR